MPNLSNYSENMLIDGWKRGGCLTTAGAAGSAAVVKGIWTASTAYVIGDIVVPHANMTGAGGKLLRCTTAGTSGATNTLAVPNPGSTLADNTVTWTAIATIPALNQSYAALFTSTKGSRANSTAYALNDTVVLTANDGLPHFYKVTTAGTTAAAQSTLYPGAIGEAITDGTAVLTEQSATLDVGTLVEVTGGSYARVAVAHTLANMAGTQAAASTTASTGTGGTTSNNNAITFASPTANWHPTGGLVVGLAFYDSLTGGNMLEWSLLTVPKSVSNGDAAPSFVAAAYTFQIDN